MCGPRQVGELLEAVRNTGAVAGCVAMALGVFAGDCLGQDTTNSRPLAIVSDGRGTWTPDNGWRLIEELRLGAVDGPAPGMGCRQPQAHALRPERTGGGDIPSDRSWIDHPLAGTVSR